MRERILFTFKLSLIIVLFCATPKCVAAPSAVPAPDTNSAQEDAGKKSELVNTLLSEQGYLAAQLVDKCFSFKWSPSTWDAFNKPGNPNEMGKGSMAFWIQDLTKYAKQQGFDFSQLEVSDLEVEKQNRPMIDKMIADFRSKFSMTIISQNECKGKAYEMTMRYPWEVLQRLGHFGPEWAPQSGQAHFTVILSPTAKDIAVKTSPDGKNYTVSGPVYTEAYDTQNKISNGLDRTNKNR